MAIYELTKTNIRQIEDIRTNTNLTTMMIGERIADLIRQGA